MCDYQGHEFGAWYLDSICIDGFLWDADSGDMGESGWEYDNGGDIPCPKCNHAEWLDCYSNIFTDEGYSAYHDKAPRVPPYDAEKLKYPEDIEVMRTFWLQGYDEAQREASNAS